MGIAKKVTDKIADAAVGAANYVKDVVTLKKFGENFFKDSKAFDDWFAHGSSEAANMVLHGQPAPIYSRSTSPPLSQEAAMDDQSLSLYQEAEFESPMQWESPMDNAIECAACAPDLQAEQEMSQ